MIGYCIGIDISVCLSTPYTHTDTHAHTQSKQTDVLSLNIALVVFVYIFASFQNVNRQGTHYRKAKNVNAHCIRRIFHFIYTLLVYVEVEYYLCMDNNNKKQNE